MRGLTWIMLGSLVASTLAIGLLWESQGRLVIVSLVPSFAWLGGIIAYAIFLNPRYEIRAKWAWQRGKPQGQ